DVPSADEPADRLSAYDLIVDHDDVGDAQDVAAAAADQSSDYPVLPALDGRIEVLEETEAALRKIREQFGDEQAVRKASTRRWLLVVSGLGVTAALALVAVDVQLGLAHLPGL